MAKKELPENHFYVILAMSYLEFIITGIRSGYQSSSLHVKGFMKLKFNEKCVIATKNHYAWPQFIRRAAENVARVHSHNFMGIKR